MTLYYITLHNLEDGFVHRDLQQIHVNVNIYQIYAKIVFIPQDLISFAGSDNVASGIFKLQPALSQKCVQSVFTSSVLDYGKGPCALYVLWLSKDAVQVSSWADWRVSAWEGCVLGHSHTSKSISPLLQTELLAFLMDLLKGGMHLSVANGYLGYAPPMKLSWTKWMKCLTTPGGEKRCFVPSQWSVVGVRCCCSVFDHGLNKINILALLFPYSHPHWPPPTRKEKREGYYCLIT